MPSEQSETRKPLQVDVALMPPAVPNPFFRVSMSSSEALHHSDFVIGLVLERHASQQCSQFLRVSPQHWLRKHKQVKLVFNLLSAGFTCCFRMARWPPGRHVCSGTWTRSSCRPDFLGHFCHKHLARILPRSQSPAISVQKIRCTELLQPQSTTNHPTKDPTGSRPAKARLCCGPAVGPGALIRLPRFPKCLC